MSEAGTYREVLNGPAAGDTLSDVLNISLSEDRLRHWAILDTWTPTEAAAIVMQVDPHIAQWEKIRYLPESDPSVQRFRDIRRLLMRSSKIAEEPAPRAILRFLRSRGIAVPQHIFESVQNNGIKPTSQAESGWKKKFQDLEIRYKAATQAENYRRVMNIRYLVGYLSIVHAKINIDGNNSLYKQVDLDLEGFDVHMSDDTARSIIQECLALLKSEDGLVEKLRKQARKHRRDV